MQLVDALNYLLNASGLRAVASISVTNVYVADALQFLARATSNVQDELLACNIRVEQEFTPAVDLTISMPSGSAYVFGNVNCKRVQIIDGDLFNLTDSTDEWTAGQTVRVTYTLKQAFDDLPEHVQAYIMNKAAELYVGAKKPQMLSLLRAASYESQARMLNIEAVTDPIVLGLMGAVNPIIARTYNPGQRW